MKKTTLLEWDIIAQAGISEDVAKQIRTLELLNTSSSGGARVYDMYVRVPDTNGGTTGIGAYEANGAYGANEANGANRAYKFLNGGQLIIQKNGQRYTLQGQLMK